MPSRTNKTIKSARVIGGNNVQDQRREPAATGPQIQTELNGWLQSAACWGQEA